MIYLLLIAKASKLWLIHSIDVSFKHTDTCWLSSKMYITKCKSYLKQREHFVLYISFKKMFSHSLPPPLKKKYLKSYKKREEREFLSATPAHRWPQKPGLGQARARSHINQGPNSLAFLIALPSPSAGPKSGMKEPQRCSSSFSRFFKPPKTLTS